MANTLHGEGASRHSASKGTARQGPFIPLFILAIALAVWFGFQAVQLVKERGDIRTTIAAQETTIQNAKKLRDALDNIARETALLADKGNQNAKLVVDELKKRGITINPNGSSNPLPAADK